MKKVIFTTLLCLIGMQAIHAEVIPSDRMRKIRNEFQDRKLGIFIHWGIYSMLGDGE